MPLVEPGNGKLREKILLLAPGKAGKTSSYLSIAWWAFKSGDTRKFFIVDTDLAVRDVLNEPKYDGMLAEDGGNLHIFEVVDWVEYQEASRKILAEAVKGDWIVIDFITHAWSAVQEDFVLDAAGMTLGQSLSLAGKKGLSGWDMYSVDLNWVSVNGAYFDFIKPLLLKSRAHMFMVAEQNEINEKAKKLSEKDREHLREFGKYAAKGQKALPYQCRSYLRLQRLARGRVLFTLGDRARTELNGETMKPDFFSAYLKSIAGWSISSPEVSGDG